MGYEYILSIDPGGKGGDTGIVVVRYSKFTAPEFFLKWAIPGGIDGFRDWKGEHKRIVIDAARWLGIRRYALNGFEEVYKNRDLCRAAREATDTP